MARPKRPRPLDPEALAKQERDRLARNERQRRWRERAKFGETPLGSGAILTLHLTDQECAALDVIARELYQRNPFDPSTDDADEVTVFPGRPAAVRALIAAFRSKRGRVRAPASRAACAYFWRAEASYRRARDPHVEAPIPPW